MLLLLIYIIYRRRQEQSDEDQPREEQGETSEDINHHGESTEYRQSVARVLSTIAEEKPIPLSPLNSNPIFSPVEDSPTSPPAKGIRLFSSPFACPNIDQLLLDQYDTHHSSSFLSLRQRAVEKNESEEIDDFVQIPPLDKIEYLHAHPKKDSAKPSSDLEPIIDEAGHPVIFRKCVSRIQRLAR